MIVICNYGNYIDKYLGLVHVYPIHVIIINSI